MRVRYWRRDAVPGTARCPLRVSVTLIHTSPLAHRETWLCGRHDADSGFQATPLCPCPDMNIFMRGSWDEGAHAPVTEMRELMLPLMGEALSSEALRRWLATQLGASAFVAPWP